MVVALGDAYLVDDTPGHHGFGQPEEVVLVYRDVDDLELPVVLGQFLNPVHLEFSLFFLCVPDAIAVDHDQPRVALVVLVVLQQAAFEQLHLTVFGNELAVVFVEY